MKEAGIFNAEIRDMFVSNELALKYSGLRDGDIITPQSVPDIYLFQSGDHYAVIEFYGIVGGTVGLDFVFDIVGASYALYKGDNTGFAVYSASVLIPFANGATSKSLIKVAENLNSMVSRKVGPEFLQGVFKTNGDNILIKLSDDLAKKGLRDNHILLFRIDMLTKTEANDLLQDLSHSEKLLTAMQQDSELVEIWVKFKTAKAGNSLKRDGDLLKKAKQLNCE